MSLMFAKQFSEAGVTGSGPGRKGGRGKGGSGLMAKPKGRNRRDGDDAGGGDTSSSGGLFNTDSAYRTHMLFPGRKDDDLVEPRRSSGSSPGFMKTMMASWGSKRPSSSQDGGMMTTTAASAAVGGRHHHQRRYNNNTYNRAAATIPRSDSDFLYNSYDQDNDGVDRSPLLLASPDSPPPRLYSSAGADPSLCDNNGGVFVNDPLLCAARKTVSFHDGLPIAAAAYNWRSGDTGAIDNVVVDPMVLCDPLQSNTNRPPNGHLPIGAHAQPPPAMPYYWPYQDYGSSDHGGGRRDILFIFLLFFTVTTIPYIFFKYHVPGPTCVSFITCPITYQAILILFKFTVNLF
jgi:hypothetical protein